MKYNLFFKRKTHDNLLDNNKTFRNMMMRSSVIRAWSISGVTVSLYESNAYENAVLEDLIKFADSTSCKEREVA